MEPSACRRRWVCAEPGSRQRLQPDYAIVIDTFMAGGTPDVDDERELPAHIGQGPVLLLANSAQIAHPAVTRYMWRAAEAAGITLQPCTIVGKAATDSGPIHTSAEGCHGGLGLARRYSHTPSAPWISTICGFGQAARAVCAADSAAHRVEFHHLITWRKPDCVPLVTTAKRAGRHLASGSSSNHLTLLAPVLSVVWTYHYGLSGDQHRTSDCCPRPNLSTRLDNELECGLGLVRNLTRSQKRVSDNVIALCLQKPVVVPPPQP